MINNNNNNNTLTSCLFVSLTEPKILFRKNTGELKPIYSSIASVFYTHNINIRSIDVNSILLKMKNFKVKKIILLLVVKELQEDYSTITGDNSYPYPDLTIIYVNEKFIFSYEFMEWITKVQDFAFSGFIIGFENANWAKIVLNFRIRDLEISSGSNTKKHLFSPNHMRLSQFIFCFLDGNYNKLVADSFHNTATHVLSKQMNHTKKEIKNYIEKEKEKLKKERDLENNTNNSANTNLDYVKIVEYLSSKMKNDNSIENIKREMKNVRDKFGYVAPGTRSEVKGKKDFHTLVVRNNQNCKEINRMDTPKPLKLESINEKTEINNNLNNFKIDEIKQIF